MHTRSQYMHTYSWMEYNLNSNLYATMIPCFLVVNEVRARSHEPEHTLVFGRLSQHILNSLAVNVDYNFWIGFYVPGTRCIRTRQYFFRVVNSSRTAAHSMLDGRIAVYCSVLCGYYDLHEPNRSRRASRPQTTDSIWILWIFFSPFLSQIFFFHHSLSTLCYYRVRTL